MKRLLFSILGVFILFSGIALAQDLELTGTWEGKLESRGTDRATKYEEPISLVITKENSVLTGEFSVPGTTRVWQSVISLSGNAKIVVIFASAVREFTIINSSGGVSLETNYESKYQGWSRNNTVILRKVS